MHLNEKDFLTVIASTPLVSVDLVLRSPTGRILLGLRQNEPAKGFWFVPGGRIQKGETLPVAFQRICKSELDRAFVFDEANLLGAFTHIYDTNGLNEPGVATHYVVLAYEIEVSEEWMPENLSQHSQWKWCARQEADATVHGNVLPYMNYLMTDNQYNLLNSRRDTYNSLIWQTPSIAIIAQAFLLSIVFDDSTMIGLRSVAALLAALCGLASLHLICKHRYYEENISTWLSEFEESKTEFANINKKLNPGSRWLKLSSYGFWRNLIFVFISISIFSLVSLQWESILNLARIFFTN